MQVKFTQEFCVLKWLQRAVGKRLTASAAFLGAPWGSLRHKRLLRAVPPTHRKAGLSSKLTVISVCQRLNTARSNIALGLA